MQIELTHDETRFIIRVLNKYLSRNISELASLRSRNEGVEIEEYAARFVAKLAKNTEEIVRELVRAGGLQGVAHSDRDAHLGGVE